MDKIALTADELNDLVKITAPDIPSDLGGIVNELVKYIFPAAGIALLIYIIIGGYQMMLSGGDPKNIAAGKEKITNAIIGFIIVFAAYWIAQAVAVLLGLRTIGGFGSGVLQ